MSGRVLSPMTAETPGREATWASDMLIICNWIDAFVRRLGTAAAFLIVLVALVQVAVSILRYFYSYALIVMQELIFSLNVVLVSASICYAVLRDVHTRVDILTERLQEAERIRAELVLVTCLLWPTSLLSDLRSDSLCRAILVEP